MLFEDETDILLFPPLRAAWARKGQQAQVRLQGHNAKRILFGAINPCTGRRLFLPRYRQRSEDFQDFLELVRRSYRAHPIALILDEDPSHTAKASQHLAAKLGIELLWLPKRSPHLNPMDHLWRAAKQNVAANRQYKDVDDEVERIIAYLSHLTRTEALRKAGILSRHFWLRDVMLHYFCGPT